MVILATINMNTNKKFFLFLIKKAIVTSAHKHGLLIKIH